MKDEIIEKFQITVLNWYKQYGRNLPWRNTNDPYKIMIAEFLLQKTDVDKVKPIYKQFIFRWPSIQLLSKESISSEKSEYNIV